MHNPGGSWSVHLRAEFAPEKQAFTYKAALHSPACFHSLSPSLNNVPVFFFNPSVQFSCNLLNCAVLRRRDSLL